MEEKIKELAKKYDIPAFLLKEVIQMEKEKVVLRNRQLVPKIVQLIENYSEGLRLIRDEDKWHCKLEKFICKIGNVMKTKLLNSI